MPEVTIESFLGLVPQGYTKGIVVLLRYNTESDNYDYVYKTMNMGKSELTALIEALYENEISGRQ